MPIISWLILRGRCRKCGKKIGLAEILAEVGVAAGFLGTFLAWPWRAELMAGGVLEILKFIIFLTFLVALAVLLIFDARWKEMPVKIMWAAVALGAGTYGLVVLQRLIEGEFGVLDLVNLLGAMMILPGFYYLLFRLSKEKWVGGGDWILCLALAFMLGDFWLALACLFLANFLGSVVMTPVVIVKRKRKMKIPFGPFLIVGFLVVFLAQKAILSFVGV